MTYIEGLTNAILQTHGVEARHIETVHVVEIFMAGFAWDGDVEVFQVRHPSGATRCYAWGYPRGDDPSRYQYVCVLGIGPVVSPRNAVVAAIRAEAKKNRLAKTKIHETHLDQRSAPEFLSFGQAEAFLHSVAGHQPDALLITAPASEALAQVVDDLLHRGFAGDREKFLKYVRAAGKVHPSED